jgi:hypothetical protein
MDARVEEIRKLLPQAMLPIGYAWEAGWSGFCGINIIRKRTTQSVRAFPPKHNAYDRILAMIGGLTQ